MIIRFLYLLCQLLLLYRNNILWFTHALQVAHGARYWCFYPECIHTRHTRQLYQQKYCQSLPSVSASPSNFGMRVSIIRNCRAVVMDCTGPAAGPRFKEIKKKFESTYSDLNKLYGLLNLCSPPLNLEMQGWTRVVSF